MRQSITFALLNLLSVLLFTFSVNAAKAPTTKAKSAQPKKLTPEDVIENPPPPASKEIMGVFDQFNKQKNELLKADLNKKNFKEKTDEFIKKLNASYDEVRKIEQKSEVAELVLTPEGNQMGYDIEILEPLKDLASSPMSKEDCSNARHENELNFPVLEDEDAKAISQIISKICTE